VISSSAVASVHLANPGHQSNDANIYRGRDLRFPKEAYAVVMTR
jgi:hypothetical protein